MNNTRNDTLFALRYAVRVLERHARMWGHIGLACKFASLLSGTAALTALASSNKQLALGLGILFAVIQALEHAFGPAERRAQSLNTRRDYARVLAAQASHSDEALEAAYQAAVAEDEICVGQSFKELAYNDVVKEQGLDETACYPGHGLLQVLS